MNLFLERFWAKVDRTPDCWLWTGSLKNGYGEIGDPDDHARRLYAHRLSYEMHHGPVPVGLHVLHHCDTKACVRPDHLYAGSQSQNACDAVARGQLLPSFVCGEQHGMHKLTDAQVDAIRADYSGGVGQKAELARQYGVSKTHINRIITRQSRTRSN